MIRKTYGLLDLLKMQVEIFLTEGNIVKLVGQRLKRKINLLETQNIMPATKIKTNQFKSHMTK